MKILNPSYDTIFKYLLEDLEISKGLISRILDKEIVDIKTRVFTLDRFFNFAKKFSLMAIICKRCGSSNCIRNGKVRGKQRYFCKECDYNFVLGDQRIKVNEVGKTLALLLYGTGGVSLNFIARLFNVSPAAVLKWIRKAANKLPEPKMTNKVQEVQVDEFWHFIKKSDKKYGYGEPWMILPIELLPGISVIVLLKRFNNSTNKNFQD